MEDTEGKVLKKLLSWDERRETAVRNENPVKMGDEALNTFLL